jgi:hypothetical protein
MSADVETPRGYEPRGVESKSMSTNARSVPHVRRRFQPARDLTPVRIHVAAMVRRLTALRRRGRA